MQKGVAIGCAVFISAHPVLWMVRLAAHVSNGTREDHPQVMNACVRLYADAANAKTKLENGFDLSDYDERALRF